MNIQLIAEQIGRIQLTLETTDAFEVYGGTWLGSFEVSQTGTAQWTLTVREKVVAAAPLRDYKVYARQLATGREWEVLSGKILVSARTAAVPADKLAPVEYFVTVPVVDHDVDAVGSTIVQGIPGPQGPQGEKGDPGEGGMTDEERATLAGAAQRDSANTFTASNTFTGEVDMSTAQVTPPEGWNVEGVTAEQVQAVVPIKWNNERVVFGEGAISEGKDVSLGKETIAYGSFSVAAGFKATAYHQSVGIGGNITSEMNSVGVGRDAYSAQYSVACGYTAKSNMPTTVTLGAYFADTEGTHTCTTEGTGSITIGAGANTLNNGTTESSNSVTIGCKASNNKADSVVIGAQARNSNGSAVVIGANAGSGYGSSIIVGNNAKNANAHAVVIGFNATGSFGDVVLGGESKSEGTGVAVGRLSYSAKGGSISIGYNAKAKQNNTIVIGMNAAASDYGATVIRSSAEDGTYTQLYFSGANTPLANTYENGAPMLGYVTKDAQGNVVAAGTRSLIELLTNNSTFAPASLNEDGEWVAPKVFHPSDLDMPQEEPQEPEEYQPLPVYPIVEPELEDLPPHSEVENS